MCIIIVYKTVDSIWNSIITNNLYFNLIKTKFICTQIPVYILRAYISIKKYVFCATETCAIITKSKLHKLCFYYINKFITKKTKLKIN